MYNQGSRSEVVFSGSFGGGAEQKINYKDFEPSESSF